MQLSKQQLAVLRAIKKNRFSDTRQVAINRLVTGFSAVLAISLALAMIGYLVEAWALLLPAGFGAGVACAFLYYQRSRVRLWPMWVQIIDWHEVDHLLGENDELTAVPTLEVAQTAIQAAPGVTVMPTPPATDIQLPNRDLP